MLKVLAFLGALSFLIALGCGPRCQVGEMAVTVCTFCTQSLDNCTQTDEVCRPRCISNEECGRGSLCTASGYCSISPVCN